MDVPVVTDEEYLAQVIKKYYPQVKPLYIPQHAQILEFLVHEYDVLFVSSANYRKDLSPLLEVIFRKKMQFWYCPHGNSDKPMKQFGQQNLSLIYGNQMEDRLKNQEILPKLDAYVKTSNYRFPFYWKYQDFYDKLAQEEVFSGFKKKQTTILYAPTWQDLESSSSLFDVGLPLVEQLPDSYNLIVKLHPWLEHHQPGYVNLIREKYQDRPNVVVLSLFPLVLPLLKRTDIYLGDFSSIGYDFLYFNRPMFFFDAEKRTDKEREASNFLHSCGIQIPESAYNNIYSFIKQNLDQQEEIKEKRSKLYRYTFGEDRDFDEIRKELNALALKLRDEPPTCPG